MRGFPILAGLAAPLLGAALGLGLYTFTYAKGYSYLTDNPAACMNCHVMRTHYDGWLKSSHRLAASCNDCHTPHNLVGKYAVKADNGFWHSFYFTTGKYPDTIQITKLDLKIAENNCRRCHANITAEIDRPSPRLAAAHAAAAKPLQCTRCHGGVGHQE